MDKAVSRGQALNVSASVALDVSWDEIDGDLLQKKFIELPLKDRRALMTAALQKIINDQVAVICPFPIWKTIRLGTGLKTSADFRKALKQSGCDIGDWAKDILGKPAFTVSATETEVDLANVSVADLGFKNGAKRSEIYDRAKELGLALCPAEVGPQLRLQYLDQPNDERLRIAMEPIADSGRVLGVFFVERYDGGDRWLSADYGFPEYFWNAGDRFVFASSPSFPRVVL